MKVPKHVFVVVNEQGQPVEIELTRKAATASCIDEGDKVFKYTLSAEKKKVSEDNE